MYKSNKVKILKLYCQNFKFLVHKIGCPSYGIFSLSLFVVGCFCFSLSRFDFISYDMTCVLPMSWKFSQILGPAVFVL